MLNTPEHVASLDEGAELCEAEVIADLMVPPCGGSLHQGEGASGLAEETPR